MAGHEPGSAVDRIRLALRASAWRALARLAVAQRVATAKGPPTTWSGRLRARLLPGVVVCLLRLAG